MTLLVGVVGVCKHCSKRDMSNCINCGRNDRSINNMKNNGGKGLIGP